MKSILFILISILLILNQTNQQNFSTAEALFADAEAKLDTLVNQVNSQYYQLCGQDAVTCATKIFNECSDITPELDCVESGFVQKQSCPVNGAFMSWDYPAGRCSNDVPCNTQEDKQLACAMATLYDNPNVDIRHGLGDSITFSYIGFYNSFRMIYPYQHTGFGSGGTCSEYDPRFRPWYVGAATGAKNVILVLDMSGSMFSRGNRAEIAKEAAIVVLSTLGQQDWFGLVIFGEEASVPENTMQKATKDNIDRAINTVRGVTQAGLTNYEDALTAAYDLITATTASEFGSFCENMILFLTDGDPTTGSIQFAQNVSDSDYETNLPTQLTNTETLMDTLMDQEDAVVFTYAIGDQVREDIPKKISCMTGGLHFNIADGASDQASLISQMRSYYDYLALGIDRSDYFYSEIYEDSITQRDTITVSKPIQISNSEGTQILLGVAGVDVDVAKVSQLSGYQTTINSKWAQARLACQEFKLSESDADYDTKLEERKCQVKSLRQNDYTCETEDAGLTCNVGEIAYLDCGNDYTTTSNIFEISYQRGENGQQIKYSDSELSPCCPSGDNNGGGAVVSGNLLDSKIVYTAIVAILGLVIA